MGQIHADNALMDVAEAARYLRINEYTLRRLAREQKIPAFKVGGSWRFRRTELDGWGGARASVAEPAVAAPVPGRGILVVDDEEGTLNLVRRILERAGYSVRTAMSGVEALELMGQETPELVFLDLFMTGMTGADLLGRIRAEWGYLPVVILTGHPDGELMQQALQYSPALLLSKPRHPAADSGGGAPVDRGRYAARLKRRAGERAATGNCGGVRLTDGAARIFWCFPTFPFVRWRSATYPYRYLSIPFCTLAPA